MSADTECKCPPKPSWSLGSMASGSATEANAQDRWEAKHGHHANAEAGRMDGELLAFGNEVAA